MRRMNFLTCLLLAMLLLIIIDIVIRLSRRKKVLSIEKQLTSLEKRYQRLENCPGNKSSADSAKTKQPSAGPTGQCSAGPTGQCSAGSTEPLPPDQMEDLASEERKIGEKQYRDLIVILEQNSRTRWEELGFRESFWCLLGKDECARILGRAKDISIVIPALRQGIARMFNPRDCQHFLRHVPEGESRITGQILAKSEELFREGRRNWADELQFWKHWYQAASPMSTGEKLPNEAMIQHICQEHIMELATSDKVGSGELPEIILSLPDEDAQEELVEKLIEEGGFDSWYKLALPLRAEAWQDPWLLELAEGMVSELDQTFSDALLRLRNSQHEKVGVEQLLRHTMARIASTWEATELLRSLKGRIAIPEYSRRKVLRTAIYFAKTIFDWDNIPWGGQNEGVLQLRTLGKVRGTFEEWYNLACQSAIFVQYKIGLIAFSKAVQQAKSLEQWLVLYRMKQSWERQVIPVRPPAPGILEKIRTCPATREEVRMEFLKNQSYPELAEILSERMGQTGPQSP